MYSIAKEESPSAKCCGLKEIRKENCFKFLEIEINRN